MHELRPARCELDNPTHAALARADVIVADDIALKRPDSLTIRFPLVAKIRNLCARCGLPDATLT